MNRMLKYKPRILQLDLTVFLTLFLSGSFLTSNDIIAPIYTKLLWCLVAFLLLCELCRQKKKLTLPFVFIPLLLSILLSGLANGNIGTIVNFCISIGFAYLTMQLYAFVEFKHSYVRVLKFLCVVSLVMYLLLNLFPGLGQIWQVRNSNDTGTYANFIIFVKNVKEGGIGRNNGMYWEPGAFQTFASVALLFEILEKKPNKSSIFVFVATIITTFSTTGYIALVLILLFARTQNKADRKQVTGLLIVILFVIVLLFAFLPSLFFSTEEYTVFGKLILYFTDPAYRDRVTSVSIRLSAIDEPIKAFLSSPIFGVGAEKLFELSYETTLGVTSCTFLNWFAVYGLLCGAIMVGGVLKMAKALCQKRGQRFLFFVIFFVITISENYITNTAVIILLLYGYVFRSTYRGKRYVHALGEREAEGANLS